MQEKVANTTPAAPLKLDVSVRVIEPVKNLMGFASVKFNDCFVVENLKIVQGSKGLFLGMPSQPDGKGGYRDMAEAEPETQNPFTPDGTGTVVDNATDEDGKEFYTITTADESVFYLVIDKQKTSENVYFLNTVTTDDLLPLAEQGKEPPKEVTPEPEPKPTEPVEEVPEPEPEKKDSPLLSILLIGAVVLAGGGIGYYFKIYKPKHEAPDLEDDYCEYEDGELEEIAEEPEDEDTPPWEEDTEE